LFGFPFFTASCNSSTVIGSFYQYRFRKYLSYGFPIITFRNPTVLLV
jgi:hypothetical protein